MVALFVLFLFLFFVSLDLAVLKFQKKSYPAFEITPAELSQLSFENNIPNFDEIFFSPGHTWLKFDNNGFVNLGVDEFASKVLGKIPVSSCSSINERIKKGDILFQSESGNKKLKFLSPIDGIINSIIPNPVNKTNSSPYNEWVIKLQPNDFNKKQNSFLTGTEASKWMKKEFVRLENFFSQHTTKKELAGVTMFDGGTIAEGAIFNLPENKIELFEKEFLSL